jgi:L-methionine (R)-S-oxide reductase
MPVVTDDDLVRSVSALADDALGVDERAARIASAIREQGDHRWVGVYEVTDTEVRMLGYAGPGAPVYPRFPRTQGLTASAVATGQTVTVDDVTADPRYLTAFGTTRSEMIVPVLDAAGAVVGTIDVESDRAAAFGAGRRALIERCAAVILALYRTD